MSKKQEPFTILVWTFGFEPDKKPSILIRHVVASKEAALARAEDLAHDSPCWQLLEGHVTPRIEPGPEVLR